MKFPDSFNLAAALLVAAVALAPVSAAGVTVPTAPRMAGTAVAGFLAGLSFALIRRDEVSSAALCGYGLAVFLTAAVGLVV